MIKGYFFAMPFFSYYLTLQVNKASQATLLTRRIGIPISLITKNGMAKK